MAVIKISAFAGERPLINPRLLPETAAKTASNVRLDDGALTPVNKSSKTLGLISNAAHKTIYRHAGTWLSWSGTVHAAPGPVAEDRLYYTGDGAPKMRVGGDVYPLAVPAPASAPSVAASGTGSGDVQSRTYVFTWVTAYDEESAPSPTSAIIDWQPGETITLSGLPAVPTGRNINRQRFYRSQTGSSGTYLYFIAERAASTSDFVDNIAVDAFNEALPSAGWTPPPDSMVNLISMPNGMMAASSGRDVLFCEPYHPHAWPDRYSMTCDAEVVGLCSIGAVLIVMTKGNPYLMSGSHPDSMQSQKLEGNFPCINARGIVDLGFAACYPSHDGLITVGPDGAISMATRELFSRDDWLDLSPTTIVAAQNGGNYVMFYDRTSLDGNRYAGAILINVTGVEYLSRSAEIADAVFYDTTDSTLYFKRPGDVNIYHFDDPSQPAETYVWQSKEFWLTRPESFGAVMIDLGGDFIAQSAQAVAAERQIIIDANQVLIDDGGLMAALNETEINGLTFGGDHLMEFPHYASVTVSVYGDRKLVRTISTTGSVERLPANFKARLWEIAVSANLQVAQIMMAGTVDELRNAQ